MSALSTIPNIVPILSGKGGVGKSSVTVQIALSLCLQGYSVGVLDIDLTGPSIPRLFGIEDAKVRQAPGGWLPVQVHDFMSIAPSIANGSTPADNGDTTADSSEAEAPAQQPKQIGALHVMSLGFLLRTRNDAVIWRGPKKTAMVGQLLSEVLWPTDTDYVLIDTPPGTSDEHISLVTGLLDPTKFPPGPITRRRRGAEIDETIERTIGAVIVTTPQAISTSDVKKELSFCYKVGLNVYGVVENMAGYVCPCCGEVTNVFSKGGGSVMAKEWSVGFLGSAPLDGEGWGMLVEERKWPRYGGEKKEDEMAPTAEMQQSQVIEPDRDESAPMVEKYTACSLCPIFKDIVRQVVSSEPQAVVPPASSLG